MIGRLTRLRVHYAWFVVAAAFVGMLVAAGVRSTPGILILPLEQEFGWARPVVSLAVSINLLLFGLAGPFAAAIMERVGMRAVMVGALLLMTAAVGLTTLMTAPWQMYLLWGLLVGVATGTLSGWVAATVSTRWFVEKRGMVVGILTTANATGQMVFLPALAFIVQSFGWRAVALAVTGAAFVAIPLILAVARNYPHDLGLLPYGAHASTPPPAPVVQGNPFRSAVDTLGKCFRNRDFWLLSGTYFVCGASTNGLVGTHLVAASHDHGMTEVVAASLLASIGVFNMFGAVISGWLSDRMDNRVLLGWYYGLRGLSLLVLPFAYDAGFSGMAFFAVFYGLDWVATVPPTVRLTADHFGKANVGRVYAWILVMHQIGAAAVAYGAGWMRYLFGTYTYSFILSGLLCLVAVFLALQIRRIVPRDAAVAAAN